MSIALGENPARARERRPRQGRRGEDRCRTGVGACGAFLGAERKGVREGQAGGALALPGEAMGESNKLASKMRRSRGRDAPRACDDRAARVIPLMDKEQKVLSGRILQLYVS